MRIDLPDFAAARVLVVGDVMLDRYWHGDTRRISPEAPVPVVRVGEAEERPGGAANVALNIAALGGVPSVLGLVGEDAAAASLTERLEAAGVSCRLVPVAGAPTITKLRVISRHQQLIRLDFEDAFDGFDREGFIRTFDAALAEADLVVLSDYAKGTLRDAPELIRRARAAGRPVLVDPKGTDFSRYRGADLITPNLGEFEAVVGPCPGERDLVERGAALMREHGLGAILVTRGEHGMTLLRGDQPELHLPARAKEVFDVTGAGDTVIATVAAALAAGSELAQATALSNLAASIVVGKLGTATVNVAELRRGLLEARAAGRGVVTEEQLMAAMELARAEGERIVMTNGCFDLLHAGHVAYLEEARRLGDRLIVAVNDDDSVRRLKGAGRPVNTLERRMAVLAALSAVDWVLPFSEDTPERLICRVLPDVLVKGGDYRPEDIAGAACVREHGGEVKVLGYLEGHSTTEMIRSIRGDLD